MNHTRKLLKYVIVLLVALMMVPGIGMAKRHQTTDDSLQKALVEAETQAQKEICKIAENDCQKVVDLLYEIFMVQDYERGYDIVDEGDWNYKVVVLEPYATQLKKMNLSVLNFDRMRDGGSTALLLSDGTKVFFDNNISKALSGQKLDDPKVTLPTGREFYIKLSAEK